MTVTSDPDGSELDGLDPLAKLAVRAIAIAEDVRALSAALDEIAELHGPDGIPTTALMWCEIVADHLTDGRFRDDDIRHRLVFQPQYLDTVSGQRLSVEDTDPSWVWAGRFLAAFAALDEPTVIALYDSLPTGVEAGKALHCLARMTLNITTQTPRGHSLQTLPEG